MIAITTNNSIKINALADTLLKDADVVFFMMSRVQRTGARLSGLSNEARDDYTHAEGRSNT